MRIREESGKRSSERSLRPMVRKWLPVAEGPARVTAFGRTGAGRVPYVSVAVERAGELLSIIFFRHRDGTWCVFPPCR
ncbi:hypothetical protein K6V92_17460 [Cupriavidus respiraculi]|uniref:hypothetical protein n=1 Tax=Cupriavidus respiraculi TaxID=195930 RepID=UPI001C988E75|nr:hypothetical protein [Cupriavidus respiraculi]MBY4948404.1 hypothetical protein [Cupriavidus respiraculi]